MLFGDPAQLKPVRGSYIFAAPNCKDYKVAYGDGTDSLWRSFNVINLEENHRQGKEQECGTAGTHGGRTASAGDRCRPHPTRPRGHEGPFEHYERGCHEDSPRGWIRQGHVRQLSPPAVFIG